MLAPIVLSAVALVGTAQASHPCLKVRPVKGCVYPVEELCIDDPDTVVNECLEFKRGFESITRDNPGDASHPDDLIVVVRLPVGLFNTVDAMLVFTPSTRNLRLYTDIPFERASTSDEVSVRRRLTPSYGDKRGADLSFYDDLTNSRGGLPTEGGLRLNVEGAGGTTR